MILRLACYLVMLAMASCQQKPVVEQTASTDTGHAKVWSADKANAWYAQQKWIVGANFIPSTAINQL